MKRLVFATSALTLALFIAPPALSNWPVELIKPANSQFLDLTNHPATRFINTSRLDRNSARTRRFSPPKNSDNSPSNKVQIRYFPVYIPMPMTTYYPVYVPQFVPVQW